MTATHLVVKNFEKFQHYRDRNPPWIKLYGDILVDLAFVQLPEAAQAQLVKLWILASQFGHPLPNDPRLLAGKIGTKGRFYLDALIAAGFIIPYTASASNGASAPLAGPIAESSENAKPSVRADSQSSEFRGLIEEELASSDFSEISPIALVVWANRAVTERWGEQPAPYTPANAVELSEFLIGAGVEWQVARLSIYRQCRELQKPRPPRAVNYFRPGIEDDWGAEKARRAGKSETPPPKSENGGRPHRAPTQTVGDRNYAEADAAFAAFNAENGGGDR